MRGSGTAVADLYGYSGKLSSFQTSTFCSVRGLSRTGADVVWDGIEAECE